MVDGGWWTVIEGFDVVRPALGRDDDHRLFLILGGAFLPSQLQGGTKENTSRGGKDKKSYWS